MAHIDTFKGWAQTIRQDIDAYKALLDSANADQGAKKLAAVALLYLVSRMDLIPDWNEGIGVIDDVMVLRVCAQLIAGHERGSLPTAAGVAIDRMANEAGKITDFLGSALSDKLKSYVAKLADQAVRGRTPVQLIDDPALRKALHVELEDELAKSVPIVVTDATDAELRLKAYLTHKLQ